MSKREEGKQKRREQILAAAEDLLREGGHAFSMRDLAKRAGVAFVTPFNLFESKAGVLAALFEERLAQERERLTSPAVAGADPLDRLFDLAVLGARAYTSDPDLYLPLLRAAPAILVQTEQLLEQATGVWRLALRDAEDAGMLEPDRDLELLARTLHVGFRGAISMWAGEGVDAGEFERQAEYGVALCVQAVLTEAHRERVRARIRDLEARAPGVTRSR